MFLNVPELVGVRELPCSDDVFDITREDAASGVMIEPAPFEDIDLTEVTQTRRIPVWKHRAKSWRTRVPDHVTDGRIKGATLPSARADYATIDVSIASLCCA